MHPDLWQTFHDRVIGVPNRHLERHPVAVSAGATRRSVGDQLSILVIPEGARLFVPPPPAADSDHLVERFPAGEGVIRGVYDDQAAAPFMYSSKELFTPCDQRLSGAS